MSEELFFIIFFTTRLLMLCFLQGVVDGEGPELAGDLTDISGEQPDRVE